jgi:predicted 3-demethylubiquinone-9 3-methyltransferase (glyoxalase superfamily)
VQLESPLPHDTPEAPTPVEEQGLPSVSEVTAAQPGTSPLPEPEPEAPATEEKQDLPSSAGVAAVQPESPAPSAVLDAAGPAGKRLTPYVWLPGGVEEAAAFYVSIFRNSRVAAVKRYPEGAYAPTGGAMSATISLDGQELILLNGGPVYKVPEAFSLLVRCADQAEVDYFWERLLSGGGEESMCGWLKDRFGVSWQVIPDALLELINDPNPQRAARATEAMVKMKKIDIAALRAAVDQP